MYDPVKENSEKPRLVPLAKPKFVKYKVRTEAFHCYRSN
jgi:hypothetical protein